MMPQLQIRFLVSQGLFLFFQCLLQGQRLLLDFLRQQLAQRFIRNRHRLRLAAAVFEFRDGSLAFYQRLIQSTLPLFFNFLNGLL